MKKAILVFLIILITINITVLANPENEIGVGNFDEEYAELWNIDAVILSAIDNSFNDCIERTINQYITAPAYAREKVGLPLDDEELKKSVRETMKLDYSRAFAVYPVLVHKYTQKYASDNVLNYLVSDNKFYSVSNNLFDEDGMYYDDSANGKIFSGSKIISDDGIEFLKNKNQIISILKENNITSVDEMEVVSYEYNCTFLYIKCQGKDYLIMLYDGTGVYKWAGKASIDMFKLYPAYELTEKISLAFENVKLEKPTYSTEAESLQAEGLLKGNENGLDLLKPLTRIEAATMLLRAMGEDETADTSQVQTFSDVPSEHWGFGAAENAYNLGLVKGVGDDKFAPDESVTAEQFATMVLRAGEEPEFNWEEAINIMIDKGIISQENASTMDFFTRGDMAKIIYEARQNGLL